MRRRCSKKTAILAAAIVCIIVILVITTSQRTPSPTTVKDRANQAMLWSHAFKQSGASHEVLGNPPNTSLKSSTEINERETKPVISHVLESIIPETINEYIHLRNVAFDSKNVHIYSPSAKVGKSLENMNTLPSYKRFAGGKILFDLPTPRIVVHEEPLNTQICDQGTVRQEHAFLFSPWHTDNMFHLHNDNILPLIDNVLHMPGCGAANLQCNMPKVLYQLAGDPARLKREVQAAKILRHDIFDEVKGWEDIFSKDKPVCLASVSWGRGPHFYYVGNQPWYVNGPKSDIYPLHYWTQISEPKGFQDDIQERAFAAVRTIRSLLNLDNGTKTNRAVYIGRSKSDKRRVQNPELIMEVCSEMGWQCDTCCDWKGATLEEIAQLVSRADVVMGPHGAGLTHVLYARPSASLIDFGAPGGWKGQFTSMAMSNGNGTYIRVPTDSWPMVVSKEQIKDAFKKAS